MGGGPIAMFALFMLSLILVGILFLYGGFIAYRDGRSKTSLALFLGLLQILLGGVIYFITAIIIYNNYGKATGSTDVLMSVSLLFLSLGFLVTALSFVAYVKKHNQLLKVLDEANSPSRAIVESDKHQVSDEE